jgi:toxin ParE1/3/4
MKKKTTTYTAKWLKKAINDLDNSLDYVAAHQGLITAKFLAEQLFSAVDLIVQNPGIGHPGRVAGTRELVVSGTKYLIPFRVKETQVEILRIFHTSRKPPNLRW